jgi:hypothetical protein
MAETLKISISFKHTKKDLELYNCLMKLEDKSTEIKALIRAGMNNSIKEEQIKIPGEKPVEIDIVEEVNVMNF